MKKVRKTTALVCRVASIAMLLFVIVICLPFSVPRIMGYEAYAIVSGSMEPDIPTGSLVYAKETPPAEVEPGNVIVFYNSWNQDGSVVTHRVVENHAKEQEFLTKGDANDKNDLAPVPYSDLIGEVKFNIPFLGWLMPIIGSGRGKLYALCFLAAALLLGIVAGRLAGEDLK